MYKPKFCSDCGSRIERSRWRLWTSRQFCTECAPRFRRGRIFTPILAGLIVFSLGLAAGRRARRASPTLIIERGQVAALPYASPSKNEGQRAAGTIAAESVGAAAPGGGQQEEPPAYGPDGTSTERPTEPDEVVSICGARTQKGTPCQRRVRGTGRCWQHKGMPAMIRNTVIN